MNTHWRVNLLIWRVNRFTNTAQRFTQPVKSSPKWRLEPLPVAWRISSKNNLLICSPLQQRDDRWGRQAGCCYGCRFQLRQPFQAPGRQECVPHQGCLSWACSCLMWLCRWSGKGVTEKGQSSCPRLLVWEVFSCLPVLVFEMKWHAKAWIAALFDLLLVFTMLATKLCRHIWHWLGMQAWLISGSTY